MLMMATACLSIISYIGSNNNGRLAVLQEQERIGAAGGFELAGRRIEGVIGELEGAVMDGDAGAGVEDAMGLQRIIRRHVNGRHEPTRQIGSDGEQGEARRSEAVSDLREVMAEAGIAGEINDTVGGLDDVAAPESLVAVERAAVGEVHGGDAVDGGLGDGVGIAPIELVGRGEILGTEQARDAQGSDENGLAAAGEPAERGEIQVIIVIVAEEHNVDGREMLFSYAWVATAPRADPR